MEIGGCEVCGRFCGSARHAFAAECREFGHEFRTNIISIADGRPQREGSTCALCLWTEPARDKLGRFVTQADA